MAKASKEILIRRLGPVTVVTIARPQVRNALDRASSRALAEAFEQFEGDEEARMAVLHGEGGSFCAGADLKELAEGHVYEPWATSDFGPTRHGLAKPVLAAVEGTACAGGLGLATRIASFPQPAMLADRESALNQFDLGLDAALRAETEGAMEVRGFDAVSGAKRFADGAGRHGASCGPEEAADKNDES